MKRILLVDDDASIVGFIYEIISRLPIRLEISRHTVWSDAVFEIEDAAPFDLIITDFRMPRGREGLAVISAARMKSGETKIILMSGDTTAADRQEASPHDYLGKPFSSGKLIMMVEKFLYPPAMVDIPKDKSYPADSVQCDACGGHGCDACDDKGWLTPRTHPHGRTCEREGCGKPIPRAQVAVYCSNKCAYADAR